MPVGLPYHYVKGLLNPFTDAHFEVFALVVRDGKSLNLNLMEATIRWNSSFHDEANEIPQQIDAAECFGSADGCYGVLTIRIRKPDLNQNESNKPKPFFASSVALQPADAQPLRALS